MKIELNKENIYIGFVLFSTIFFIKYILIKPVYIIILLLVFWGVFFKKYRINMAYILISYFFISYLVYHLFYIGSDYGMVFNAIISILVFPIFYYILSRNGIDHIKFFLNLSIIYLTVEMVWRITHPIYEINNIETVSEDGGWYYPFKFNSFIFTDSNFVALHIVCLIFIALLYRLKTHTFLLFILVLLTFSRSGILGSILIILYFILDGSKYRVLFKPLFFIFLVISFLYLLINISLLTDGSFLSKFYIYDVSIGYALRYFTLSDYFLGVGLANSYDLIHIGAHSIWVILLFETGVVGLAVYLIYFSSFYSSFFIKNSESTGKLTFFFLVFLLMGFSLGLYLFPIMVLTIACILTLSRKEP